MSATPQVQAFGKKVQLKSDMTSKQLRDALPPGTTVFHEKYLVRGTVMDSCIWDPRSKSEPKPSIVVSWNEEFPGINHLRISQESYPFGDRLTFYSK